MSFADWLRREGSFTRTENGAVALNTTGSACLDLFSTAGALREAEDARVESMFAEAYKESPLLATKIVFYARDIREGLGEPCCVIWQNGIRRRCCPTLTLSAYSGDMTISTVL